MGDFLQVAFRDDSVIISQCEHFAPRHIFDCGQCFRFTEQDGEYVGIAHGRILRVREDDKQVTIYPCSEKDYYETWQYYFDLETDYDQFLTIMPHDGYLRKALEYGQGLRVLNQQPFETLITFIISANNNVSRIRKLVNKLCNYYGNDLGNGYHDFPSPIVLANANETDIKALGAGYRSRYIIETSKMIADGFDLESLKEMEYDDAKKELQKLSGVGPKVADCVLLFALGHRNAFIQDVWIKKVLSEVYDIPEKKHDAQEFIKKQFGEFGGIVQQYLFHYARNNKMLNGEENLSAKEVDRKSSV